MDKQYDFTNVADLACSLKMLNIEGSTEAFGTSNIIPNDLAFDLIGFKSLTKLVLTNVDCCPEKIQSISHVRTTLKVRKFQKEIVVFLILSPPTPSPLHCVLNGILSRNFLGIKMRQ